MESITSSQTAALATILQANGIKSASKSALLFLNLKLDEFYSMQVEKLKIIAELNNRTSLSWIDLQFVLLDCNNQNQGYSTPTQGSNQGYSTSNQGSNQDYSTSNRQSASAPLLKNMVDSLKALPKPGSKERVRVVKKVVKSKKTMPSKVTPNLSKRYMSIADYPIIPTHFPPLPESHSYMNDTIPLHPINDELNLRKEKIDFYQKLDQSLINLTANQLKGVHLDGTHKCLDYFGFGFVDAAAL